MRLPKSVYEEFERIMQRTLLKGYRIQAALVREKAVELPAVRVIEALVPGAEEAAIRELAGIMVRIDDEA